MKDYKDYYNTVLNTSSNAQVGKKNPSVFEYLIIRVVDNALVVALFFLLILFSVIGLNTTSEEFAKWFFDASKLCLGVFLGLFAAKRKN